MNVSPFGKLEVENTAEVRRIAALPRRVWTDEAAAKLADLLTSEFRRPGGTMTLRRVQAIALYEAMQTSGLFAPIRVGGGKSLLFFLLPLALQAKRPVLFLPASLIEKTWNDPTAGYHALAKHWYLPTNIQIESYELLGLVQNAQKLDYIKPDMIGGDECHHWKNRRAGRTRRMARWMHEHPETKVVLGSGTVMKGSIKDFNHLLRWALKGNAPIPATEEEAATWADALDEKVNPLARRKPTGLFKLGPAPVGVVGLAAARRVFQARLLETPGVVASKSTDGVTCSLRISGLEYKPAPITEQHIAVMRDGVKDGQGGYSITPWTTPDGWTFSEAIEFRRYVRELALGFHGVWDPRPPPEWLAARRNWAVFVREILSRSRTLDTELQVTNAVDAGQVSGGRLEDGVQALAGWRAIRDTFKIQPKPIWHDTTALETCVSWMGREKGIVWCEHVFFARRLAELSGCVYYGADGRSDAGESITHVKPGKAIIASVQANKAGRNLQMFSTNLITSVSPDALTNEQLIGRTHRDGQEADEVAVDVLIGCREHFDAFQRALDGARAAQDTLGHEQKVLLADVTMPNIGLRIGPLWA